MNWYHSANGKPEGPISPADLETLARSGTVKPETLVWREGLPNWTAYSTVSIDGTASSPSAVNSPVSPGERAQCVECGKTFSTADMVMFEKNHVCVGCKPVFFQKVREGVPVGARGAWRYKKQLVTTLEPTLPPRCIKCNAPTDAEPVKRKLYWHPPLVSLLVVLNILIYLLVAMAVRKRTTALVSVCPVHRKKRRNAILTAWLLVLGAFALAPVAIAYESPWLGIGAFSIFLGGVIYGMVKGRYVNASKIDKTHLWMTGCGKDFLAEFPEWTGA